MWKMLLMTAALCAAGQDMAGRYALTGAREMASEILLRPDGTFEFGLIYGAADYWGRGTWKREGGAVVLNSKAREQKPVKLTGSQVGKEEGIQVKVQSAQGQPIPNIDLVLTANGKPYKARTDSSGVAGFPPLSGSLAVVVEIRVYDFQSDAILLNAAHNRFQLQLDGEAITEMRFEDERLAIEGDALLLRKGAEGKPLRYVKAVVP